MRNTELANQPMNREQRRAEEKAKKNKKSTMRNVFIRVSAKNHTKDGDVTYTKEDIQKILDEWSQKKKMSFYFIEHDEDEDNVHFHIVIEFAHPTSFDVVKNHFPYGSIQECLQSYDGRGKVQYSVQYLIHMNHPNKYQYKWEDVITNNLAKLEEYKVPHSMKLNARLKILLDKILAGEIKEYNIDLIDSDLYIKYKRQIERAFEYVNNQYLKDPNRSIKIVLLVGPPRTGKSTFVKAYAKKHNMSLYLSSGSADAWGKYKGQEIACMDDINLNSFKIEEMMKMCDGNNNTAIKSRYNDRIFTGSILFLVTNVPICEWYCKEKNVHREALLKRFDYILDFTPSDIEEYARVNPEVVDMAGEHIALYTINRFYGNYNGYETYYGPFGDSYECKNFYFESIDNGKIHSFDMNHYIDFSVREKKVEELLDTLCEM